MYRRGNDDDLINILICTRNPLETSLNLNILYTRIYIIGIYIGTYGK